jgi:hypothetical protein
MPFLFRIQIAIWSAILCSLPPAFALNEANEAATLTQLKLFRLKELNRSTPPCPSHSCRLTWAAVAMVMGDPGEYARRVNFEGMAEYATTHGISQNFPMVRRLESMPRTYPYQIGDAFDLRITNFAQITRNAPQASDIDVAVTDARPIVQMSINKIPVDLIFDTGGTLMIPSASPAAKALIPLNVEAYGETGLGHVDPIGLSTANLGFGNQEIKNILVNLNNSPPHRRHDSTAWNSWLRPNVAI